MLLLFVLPVTLLTGCISPVSWEQESDWRWKQYNPEYHPPWPPDPGIGAH